MPHFVEHGPRPHPNVYIPDEQLVSYSSNSEADSSMSVETSVSDQKLQFYWTTAYILAINSGHTKTQALYSVVQRIINLVNEDQMFSNDKV